MAAILVAEIGDVHRFAAPRTLPRGPGLTPRHRESDTVVHRGTITKQGSTLVRWAAVEAAHGAGQYRHPALFVFDAVATSMRDLPLLVVNLNVGVDAGPFPGTAPAGAVAP